MIFVPGATMSGLARPSSAGPREEKAAIPLELSEGVSVAIGCVAKQKLTSSQGTPLRPPEERRLSDAPTVTTFLAVPGASSESGSTTPSPPVQKPSAPGLPSAPELPAAKKIAISGWSQMNLSVRSEPYGYPPKADSVSVIGPVRSPQLLVSMRAPNA